jgi:DNA-binding protein YbaB
MVNIANMMKQAQAMQKKMLDAQEELAKKIGQAKALVLLNYFQLK